MLLMSFMEIAAAVPPFPLPTSRFPLPANVEKDVENRGKMRLSYFASNLVL
jgi:hypothetical protein